MFFALIFGSLAETCNESLLEPGYICCKGSPCQGHCTKYNHSDDKCITETQYRVCYAGYMYPVLMLIFCIPTVIFWILSLVTKTRVPLWTWLTNIALNMTFIATVQSISCIIIIPNGLAPLLFLIIGGFIFVLTYTLSRNAILSNGPECCQCESNEPILMSKDYYENYYKEKDDQYDCLKFIRESISPRVTKIELENIFEENASLPPSPKCVAEATYEHKSSTQVVNSVEEPIQYGSWQENGVYEKITKDKVIYKCNPHCIYGSTMSQEVGRARDVSMDKIKGISGSRFVYPVFEVKGMTERAIYGDSCTFKVFTSRWYRVIYEILFILGYNGISDYFWNHGAQIIVFNSAKEIAWPESWLRAKSGERDTQRSANNKAEVPKYEEVHQSLV